MTEEEAEYVGLLENKLADFCEACGVPNEMYDQDMAAIACYEVFLSDMVDICRKSGAKWNSEEGCFEYRLLDG